jgi:hypothetical protein
LIAHNNVNGFDSSASESKSQLNICSDDKIQTRDNSLNVCAFALKVKWSISSQNSFASYCCRKTVARDTDESIIFFKSLNELGNSGSLLSNGNVDTVELFG